MSGRDFFLAIMNAGLLAEKRLTESKNGVEGASPSQGTSQITRFFFVDEMLTGFRVFGIAFVSPRADHRKSGFFLSPRLCSGFFKFRDGSLFSMALILLSPLILLNVGGRKRSGVLSKYIGLCSFFGLPVFILAGVGFS